MPTCTNNVIFINLLLINVDASIVSFVIRGNKKECGQLLLGISLLAAQTPDEEEEAEKEEEGNEEEEMRC